MAKERRAQTQAHLYELVRIRERVVARVRHLRHAHAERGLSVRLVRSQRLRRVRSTAASKSAPSKHRGRQKRALITSALPVPNHCKNGHSPWMASAHRAPSRRYPSCRSAAKCSAIARALSVRARDIEHVDSPGARRSTTPGAACRSRRSRSPGCTRVVGPDALAVGRHFQGQAAVGLHRRALRVCNRARKTADWVSPRSCDRSTPTPGTSITFLTDTPISYGSMLRNSAPGAPLRLK